MWICFRHILYETLFDFVHAVHIHIWKPSSKTAALPLNNNHSMSASYSFIQYPVTHSLFLISLSQLQSQVSGSELISVFFSCEPNAKQARWLTGHKPIPPLILLPPTANEYDYSTNTDHEPFTSSQWSDVYFFTWLLSKAQMEAGM